jgi:radical SAM superfamily enzyme YgiQ (UPF0313 family)
VFGEIEHLIDNYQINILCVLDELISFYPERLALFCQRIKKYNLKWMAQIRVDSIAEDTVRMMRDSGCFSMSIGIEHVNQSVLDGYNKHITIKQIEKALALLYNNKVGIQGNILLCGPHETRATMQEAINWQQRNTKYMVNLTAVIPYPGTDLFKLGVERGRIDPLKFLEQGCPFVQFSGVPLQMPVFMDRRGIIKSVPLYQDPSRGQIKEVTVQCPHCQEVVKYTGLYWGGSTGSSMTQGESYRIGCKSCNQRFDFNYFGG